MSDVQCLAVPLHHLQAVWPVAGPLLDKAVAIAGGKMVLDDVMAELLTGNYVLWIIVLDEDIVAAATTRVIAYPRRRGLAIDWLGGAKMKEWIGPLMRTMKEHAERNDCSFLEGYGRKAWDRWLAPEGWAPDYIAYKMELGDGKE